MIRNEWPESQVCIGCKYAFFVLEGSSTYDCEKDCDANSECCNNNRIEVSEKEWQEKFE